MKRLLAVLMVVALLASFLSVVPASAKPITPQVLEAVFIHYEHPARPGPSPESKVYNYYLLLGPKWDLDINKYPDGVPYVINPSGAPLGAELEVKAGFEAWDVATSAELFNDNPLIDTNSWWGKLDGKNNVSWQVIAGGGILAGTWLWYLDNDGSGTMTDGDEIQRGRYYLQCLPAVGD